MIRISSLVILIVSIISHSANGAEIPPAKGKAPKQRTDLRQIAQLQSNEIEEKLSTQNNSFAQKFHERLTSEDPTWFNPGVQAYYKKIAPFISVPDTSTNQWSSLVSISGHQVFLETDGIYKTREEDISFRINPSTDFVKIQALKITLLRNGIASNIKLFKQADQKILNIDKFESYKDLLKSIAEKRAWWTQKVTFKGTLPETDHDITIENINEYKNPLILRGQEVSYRKDQSKTKIFFDLTDSLGNPLDYFFPLECLHKKIGPNKKLYSVKNHKLYECNAKEITYGIFESPEQYNRWVLDKNDFYDLQQRTLTSLPTTYSNLDNHCQTPVKPLVWVLGENHDAIYELDGNHAEEDKNDYFYSASDGSLYLTLRYQVPYKEYLAEQNKIIFDSLLQIANPSLCIHNNAVILNGHRSCAEGIYQRIPFGEKRFLWQIIEKSESNENNNDSNPIIQYQNQVSDQYGFSSDFYIQFQNDKITPEQTIQWCNAAQRFFKHSPPKMNTYSAIVKECNKNIVHGLKAWTNLTQLHLSNLKLENGIEWKEILEAMGSMTQLTHFDFSNNSPIVNFDEAYESIADRATTYYTTLAACLHKLTNLRELHIQGLWLKPHQMLGYIALSSSVSREVAYITGVINHKKTIGIESLIKNIGALNHITTLSIDGIPDKGSSFWARKSGKSQAAYLLSPLLPISTFITLGAMLLAINDDSKQSSNLCYLATTSANTLAINRSLRTINLYSPGGKKPAESKNYFDYFCKYFKEKLLSTSRPSDCPALTISDCTL